MRTHLVELIGSASMPMLAGWLAASVGLIAAVRHRRHRSRGLGDDADRLAQLERDAAWGRRHLRQESDDPHAQWLGAGGAT